VADKQTLIDWLGELLWHWKGDTPISPDARAEKIMEVLDVQQIHASQFSVLSLPDAQEMLRALGTSLSRTETPSPRECLDEPQGE
jgi:hypothetical protein